MSRGGCRAERTHPHASFPALPERLVPLARVSAPSIEAEGLRGEARATRGDILVQDMKDFEGAWGGGAQLWWVGARPGDRLKIPLRVEETGSYELVGFFTRAQDYGVVRLHVNGAPAGPLMDGWAPRVEATGPISFGEVALRAGVNEIVVELVGKDARSAGYGDGYLVGIDGFLLLR